MNLGSCVHEREVSALLKRGHWPQACSHELRSHVELCRSCTGLVQLSLAFQQSRAQAAAQARLQSPSQLWWRAQLRRRNADLQRIARPIFGAQVFALAVTLVAAAAFLATQASRGLGWMSWLQEIPRSFHLDSLWSGDPAAFGQGIWILLPALATLALLGGVVVYLASEKR